MVGEDEKTCPKCAEVVKSAAIVCKHCGFLFSDSNPASAKPKSKTVRNGALGCFGLIALIVIISAISGGGNGSKEASSTAPVASASALKVTASQLAQAYESNEAAAQQNYGDRPLEVSGVIHSIDLDIMDKPFLVLDAAGSFLGAQMHLTEASQARAATLAKGQKVTAVCQKVREIAGTPMLDNCELQ